MNTQEETKQSKKKLTKFCQFNDCLKWSAFGYRTDRKAIYCSQHKTDGMIDIKHKKCLETGCEKTPNFNYQNEKQALYCKIHKADNMIDVIHKKCLEIGCDKRPNYNYQHEKRGLYCKIHKADNMIDVRNKKCLEIGCEKMPNFNYQNQKQAQFCNQHKRGGMIDIKNKKCLQCQIARGNCRYDYYCLYCFIHLFPDKPQTRNYKTKELLVSDFIKQLDFTEEYKITYDKIIENGCSKRRPDILIDCLTHHIIVEIDEGQHRNYESSCENKRLMEIYQDLGHMNLIMIRFNPDSYINEKHEKIKSCFKINKQTGLCIVDNKKQWQFRLNQLKEAIQQNLNKSPEKSITTIELFYDLN